MYWLDQLKQSKRSNILYCISTNSLLSVIPNSSSCCFLHTHRISKGAQYVTLQKYFTHPSLYSYLLVCNPTHKTESGAANWWATTNNKPHGRISTMGQSETLTRSQIILLHSFSAGTQSCCATYQPSQTRQSCWAKTIFLSQNRHIFTFFFVQF